VYGLVLFRLATGQYIKYDYGEYDCKDEMLSNHGNASNNDKISQMMEIWGRLNQT
jgi:hypothetical protein